MPVAWDTYLNALSLSHSCFLRHYIGVASNGCPGSSQQFHHSGGRRCILPTENVGPVCCHLPRGYLLWNPFPPPIPTPATLLRCAIFFFFPVSFPLLSFHTFRVCCLLVGFFHIFLFFSLLISTNKFSRKFLPLSLSWTGSALFVCCHYLFRLARSPRPLSGIHFAAGFAPLDLCATYNTTTTTTQHFHAHKLHCFGLVLGAVLMFFGPPISGRGRYALGLTGAKICFCEIGSFTATLLRVSLPTTRYSRRPDERFCVETLVFFFNSCFGSALNLAQNIQKSIAAFACSFRAGDTILSVGVCVSARLPWLQHAG